MTEPRRVHHDRIGFLLRLLLAISAIGLVLVPVATLVLASLSAPDRGAHEAKTEISRLSRDLATARADWERTVDPVQRVEIDRRIRLLAERARRLEQAPSPSPGVWSLAAYARLTARDGLDITVTLGWALLVATSSAIVCYPLAQAAAVAADRRRATIAILALVAPAALIDLMRVHAWAAALAVLDPTGAATLDTVGFAARSTMLLGLVAASLPFMLLPIWAALARLDRARIEAARDLGASWPLVHARIVLPEARPGLAVGAILTFVLAAGALALPRIVARGWGSEGPTRTISSTDWSLAAAWGTTLLVTTFLAVAVAAWLFRLRPSDFTHRGK